MAVKYVHMSVLLLSLMGAVEQAVAKPIADPDVMSSIRARPFTFNGSLSFLLQLIQERIFFSYWRKYVHEALVNLLVYACPEKV